MMTFEEQQREAKRISDNANKKQEQYRLFKQGKYQRTKMDLTATEDSIDGWYYYPNPIFTNSEEYQKVMVIKEHYAELVADAEQDENKKVIMYDLIARGIYDFEGL